MTGKDSSLPFTALPLCSLRYFSLHLDTTQLHVTQLHRSHSTTKSVSPQLSPTWLWLGNRCFADCCFAQRNASFLLASTHFTCSSNHLVSLLFPAFPRYRFSIPRLRIVLLIFCLSDPMRLDSSHIVTPRFFSPHFNRSHSTIKSVLSLKS